jgi:putative hydrolases of HD superfamily
MVTKALGPDDCLDLGPGADPVLASYYRIMRLKRLYRQGWLKRGVPAELCESVAEHSFGTALLALLLAPPAGPARVGAAPNDHPAGAGPSGGAGPDAPLDGARAALIALVHELGEAYAGDITPVDGVSAEEKSRLERESILRALEGHPGLEWFLSLWEEFEEGSSPEARFARELDRLEMGLQAALQKAEGFPGMDEFFESARRRVADPALARLLEAAIEAGSRPRG